MPTKSKPSALTKTETFITTNYNRKDAQNNDKKGTLQYPPTAGK